MVSKIKKHDKNKKIEIDDKDKDKDLEYTILATNTVIQIISLQLYKMLTEVPISIVDLASDTIILTLSNILLNKISKVNTHLNTQLKDVYYPLTSALFFSGYNNVMYNSSYIKSLSLITPITIGEYYFLKVEKY